ncbi:hypothetical protein ACFV0D_02425 [Streptomyces sp. NPDC059556]|uniref:hypothetical protein n=1 Tax=Streptomyces sp. NPDC059556 TaxID=3346863 RepID=UPI0036B85EB0
MSHSGVLLPEVGADPARTTSSMLPEPPRISSMALFMEAGTTAPAPFIVNAGPFRLGAAATGGVGDADLIAGAGVPTLDGLGPVGGADHTPGEWLDTSSVPHRVAMLACLIVPLGSAGKAS